MLSSPAPLAVALLHLVAGAALAPRIPDESQAHLGVALRLTNPADLATLLQRQQDPASPDYRRWLTPEEFGERFGQPSEAYERTARWLEGAGFNVTRYPNRAFLEAHGSAGQVNGLLSLHLLAVPGQPATVHVTDVAPTVPDSLREIVLHVSGLDTRTHFRRHLRGTTGKPSFGPQDLRRFYNVQPLMDRGYVGQHQQLAVLSEAETEQNAPSPVAIDYFLRNISDASAVFSEAVLPNSQGDFDTEPGGGALEFSLDVEMQSVGAPGADSITLVVSPASQVFSVGVNYIVNNLPAVTAVSVSLGSCELATQQFQDGLVSSFQQALEQGLAEGQTWSAATGDNGSDDCRTGSNVAVDFPASIPQMVAVGGTQIDNPNWDVYGALTAYQQETAWNGGAGGGAGGGGISILYPTPSYQEGLPFAGEGRVLPDIALIAGSPAVLSDDPLPGELFPIQGTSVASPLSAGFFALIASRVGCRLGDVHAVLYALGRAQLDGGAKVFNDITSGSNGYDGVAGESAGLGYDAVTGWGSLNVEALADAWPPCPSDGGYTDAGPGPAYDQCAILGCPADSTCRTLTEGPSSCVLACDLLDAGSCATGTICSNQTLFSAGDAGVCVPGCSTDQDCGDGGDVCETCEGVCLQAGSATAAIGDACTQSTDCPSGATCSSSQLFSNGYCTAPCIEGEGSGGVCSCPPGSTCGQLGYFNPRFECLQACATVGEACGQSGFVCQSGDDGAVCLPPCQVETFTGGSFDTCNEYGSHFACDTASGVCNLPILDSDGGSRSVGTDAGPGDGGAEDGGAADGGQDGGETAPPDAGSGGESGLGRGSHGCASGGGGPADLGILAGLLGLIGMRRRRANSI